MIGRLRNTFAEVDLSALENNYRVLQKAASHGRLIHMAPMVKANAYGHGDIEVSRCLERCGARYLGVALIEEGARLREAGINTGILFYGHFDSLGAEALTRYRITPAIGAWEQLETLKRSLEDDAQYPIHIEFNTGMSRNGFEPEDAARLADWLARQTALAPEGLCTHFATSEDFKEPNSQTAQQIQIFRPIIDTFKQRLQAPMILHYDNSAAMLTQVTPELEMARPGIAVYGAIPKMFSDFWPACADQLRPVLNIRSFVAFLRTVKPGQTVSYGATWKATKTTRIAVVPIGYADGVPRAASNQGHVLIQGQKCAIRGVVCMDWLMADVTDMKVELGDEVVVLGHQKDLELRVETMAEWADTIAYEVLTGFGPRLPRVYSH